jgi:hypothetical protein
MKEKAMMRTVLIGALTILGILMLFGAVTQGSTPPSSSIIRQELQRVRYGYASQLVLADAPFADTAASKSKGVSGPTYKSPGKAFLMSLIVPGAGQFYYGNKVKAAVFLGIEVATIGLSVKYHSDGNKLTTDYQNFNHEHWKFNSYSYYLQSAYGVSTDDSVNIGDHPEVSHHLPPAGDGQYFEMTGKYDQFAWGWDDAVLAGHHLHDTGFVPVAAVNDTTIPYSANRLHYEGMRHDANSKFTKATTMLFGTLLNHVVSAFEAYITTRRHNQGHGSGPTEFSSRIQVNAQLKSIYARRDTPYLKVTYKF